MCYYYGPRDSVYERLGHAEVVQLQLDPSREHMEFSRFADVRRAVYVLPNMLCERGSSDCLIGQSLPTRSTSVSSGGQVLGCCAWIHR